MEVVFPPIILTPSRMGCSIAACAKAVNIIPEKVMEFFVGL